MLASAHLLLLVCVWGGDSPSPSGSLPSMGTAASVSASTLPYLIGIFGPPLASMAAALAIWMMSAYERPGCLSLSGWIKPIAPSRPALQPCASSLSNRMLAQAPPLRALRS